MPATHEPALVPLDRAELIEISGDDAIAFAQAQFASNVGSLAAGTWQWSAWLTAQGRTRSVFALLRIATDHLLIWLPLGGAAELREQLARFVLRAKVRLAVRENWSVCRVDGVSPRADEPQRLTEWNGGYAFLQPGPEARTAWLGPAPKAPPDPVALNAWRLLDIAAGLPWLAPATADEFVPQALGLERLGAVRFDKGCYPGQEIAARLHYRGGVKQRLRRIVLDGNGDVSPGSAIRNATGNTGTILYGVRETSTQRAALAVLADVSPQTPLVSASGYRIIVADDT
ncbi:MAG TPA: folate-binding protein [Rhodanobacteraceae bacterium]